VIAPCFSPAKQAGIQPVLTLPTHARRQEKGKVFSRAQRRLVAPPSLKKTKYSRMRHIRKQNSKMFFPDKLARMFSLNSVVALDVSVPTPKRMEG